MDLRQHPAVLNLPFKDNASRPDRDNVIDQFLRDDITPMEIKGWSMSEGDTRKTDKGRKGWFF